MQTFRVSFLILIIPFVTAGLPISVQAPALPAQNPRPLPRVAATFDLYQRVEEIMINDSTFDNPFTETELRLYVFAPPGRKLGTKFTWYGFFDGDGNGGQNGNSWKFRLLFDTPGEWRVEAGFFIPGTDLANGPAQFFTYTVSSTKLPGEHGHIRVDPENTLRFRYDDGTPWVPFPIHSSMLLDRQHAIAKQWIDAHAALGVEVLAVRFHPEAYTLGDTLRAHFLPNQRGDTWDYDRYDVSTWRYNEEIIEYAQAKGVKLFIWFGISGMNPQYDSYGPRDNPNDFTLGPQQQAFIKYFLARWAAYTNFWHWTVDSEYEETGSDALRRNRTYAAALRDINPWKTLISDHVLSDWSPGNAPEFDIATLQLRVADSDTGVTDAYAFVADNSGYNRPVFNVEGIWALSNVDRSRVAVFSHLMAGGYGEIAQFDTDGTHFTTSWGVTWDRVNQRHKEDAAMLGMLANFFNHTDGIDISRCVPHHELVSVTGGNLAFCLAEPGESYYVWLDRGGEATLDLSGIVGDFSVGRYHGNNLSVREELAPISGSDHRLLGDTPTGILADRLTGTFGDDYLYVIQRGQSAFQLQITAPNGGETWQTNSTAQVTWSSRNSTDLVDLLLSTDDGVTFPYGLAHATANDGHEVIAIPNVTTTTARIRVQATGNPLVFDLSDRAFTVAVAPDKTPPVVTITLPAKAGQAFKGPIEFQGHASDDAGISGVEWQLDNTSGNWQVASGNESWRVVVSQPSDGSHRIFLRARDAATPSNVSQPISLAFIADNTGPEIASVLVEAGQTSATITYETDEPADTRLQWGTAASAYTEDTFTLATNTRQHEVRLENLLPATVYHYLIIARDHLGNLTISGDLTFSTFPAEMPTSFQVSMNFPNPFNIATRWSVELPETGRLQVTIFDMLGHEVRRLFDGEVSAGYKTFYWTGTDTQGQVVSTGAYNVRVFYDRASGGSEKIIRHILLLK